MKKFAFTFKNKPVRVHLKSDDSVALYFDDTTWLFLHSTGHPEKYTVDEGNFSPGKEDLALLGKLISNGIKDYDRLHHFQVIFNNQLISIEKNHSDHYYLQFPGAAASFIVARRKTTGEWYQEYFDQPLTEIPSLQLIGQLIQEKEKELGTVVITNG